MQRYEAEDVYEADDGPYIAYEDIEDLIDQVDGVMGDVDKALAQDWTTPMNMSYSTLEEIADVLRQIQEFRCD